MPPVRKTADGYLITDRIVQVVYTILGILAILVTGALGAARYLHIGDIASAKEVEHQKIVDSAEHANFKHHFAKLDSLVDHQDVINTRLTCWITKDPLICKQ